MHTRWEISIRTWKPWCGNELIAVAKTCWDELQRWNTMIKSDRLFRRDKCIDYKELPLRNNQDQVDSLWVKIRDQTSKEYLLIRVYYRPLDQGEPVAEALLHLQETNLQALILMWNFNHPNVCWEINAVSCKQSKRLPQSVEDNFLSWTDQTEMKLYWMQYSPVHRRFLRRLRLEADWAVAIMPWLSLLCWGIWAWQNYKSGLWTQVSKC